jgi:hypothetical protein
MSPKNTDEAPIEQVVLAPADFSLAIFDGPHVRAFSKEDVEKIEALPDDQRAALFEVVSMDRANIAASERHVAARTAVREKSDAYNAALNAFNGNVLQVSTDGQPLGPQSEAKIDPRANAKREAEARAAVVAAQRPGYVPAKVKANPLKPALDKAETELADARVEFQRATIDFATAEHRYGEAVVAWRALQPTISRNTLMQDHIRKGMEERARRVAAGLPADMPTNAPDPTSSPLQAAMSARGKQKTVNTPRFLGSNVAVPGSGRPILRG